ncbi:V-type ATP synthase subunit K [Patescibacteria group bacterium]|nr:V-type ATP synthase subunit K [Patescibacteria group bacterium]
MFGFDSPLAIAVLGAAIAAILGGIGSAIGVGLVGQGGAGVLTEKPEEFGKILLLEALPGTQGIYGFLGALLILIQIGLIGGAPKAIDTATAWQFFYAALPVAFTGLVSGIHQGKVAAAGLNIVAKDPANTGKAVIMSAMVETYAVLGLLVSVLLIFGIQIPAAATV